jgi:hypothetical protein
MQFKLVCPVTKIIIKLYSTELDDVGAFTKFVLQSIAEGYSISEISNVVGLGEAIVQEELSYLEQIGFLVVENEHPETYALSGRGAEFYALMDVIEKVEEESYCALVENYTGEVITLRDFIDENSTNISQSLPIKIQRQLLYNNNYNNSLELFTAEHVELLSKLSEKDRESLYTRLNFDIRETSYIELIADSSDNDLFDTTVVPDDLQSYLSIRSCKLNIKLSLQDTRLNLYRSALNTLRLLLSLDSELLSQKAKNILSLHEEEEQLNKSIKSILFNNIESGLLSVIQDGELLIPSVLIANEVTADIAIDITESKLEDLIETDILSEIKPDLTEFLPILMNTSETFDVQKVPFNLFLGKSAIGDML